MTAIWASPSYHGVEVGAEAKGLSSYLRGYSYISIFEHKCRQWEGVHIIPRFGFGIRPLQEAKVRWIGRYIFHRRESWIWCFRVRTHGVTKRPEGWEPTYFSVGRPGWWLMSLTNFSYGLYFFQNEEWKWRGQLTSSSIKLMVWLIFRWIYGLLFRTDDVVVTYRGENVIQFVRPKMIPHIIWPSRRANLYYSGYNVKCSHLICEIGLKCRTELDFVSVAKVIAHVCFLRQPEGFC